jgi:hypothetical protein
VDWIQYNQSLLWAAAWTTLRSSRLKYATYYENEEDELTVRLSQIRPSHLRNLPCPNKALARNIALNRLKLDIQQQELDHRGFVLDYNEQVAAYGDFCREQALQAELLTLSPFPPNEQDEALELAPLSLWPEDLYPPEQLELTLEQQKIKERQPDLIPTQSRMRLDSWKIRRIGFRGLLSMATCRPYAYQLPPSTPNFETAARDLSTVPEEVALQEFFYHKSEIDEDEAARLFPNYSLDRLYLRQRTMEKAMVSDEQRASFRLSFRTSRAP